jgi:hypothetical protein
MAKAKTFRLDITAKDRLMLIRLLRWNQGGPFFRHNEDWCWNMMDRIRRTGRKEGGSNGR